ncbi:MAG TPA: hypothetical protein VFG10_17610 [Saprospiraceae bacterium]|nr:hypothetical protein [Saprospiraceae bacterium]
MNPTGINVRQSKFEGRLYGYITLHGRNLGTILYIGHQVIHSLAIPITLPLRQRLGRQSYTLFQIILSIILMKLIVGIDFKGYIQASKTSDDWLTIFVTRIEILWNGFANIPSLNLSGVYNLPLFFLMIIVISKYVLLIRRDFFVPKTDRPKKYDRGRSLLFHKLFTRKEVITGPEAFNLGSKPRPKFLETIESLQVLGIKSTWNTLRNERDWSIHENAQLCILDPIAVGLFFLLLSSIEPVLGFFGLAGAVSLYLVERTFYLQREADEEGWSGTNNKR